MLFTDLTEKLNQTSKTDTVFINSISVDTVIVKETVTEYLPLERFVYVEKEAGTEPGRASSKIAQGINDDRIADSSSEKAYAGTSQKPNNEVAIKPSGQTSTNYLGETELTSTKPTVRTDVHENKEDISQITEEERTAYEGPVPNNDVIDSDLKSKTIDHSIDVTVAEEQINENRNNAAVPETIKDSVNFDNLAVSEEITAKRTDPEEKAKKPINWPKMRAGISTDFIGFNSLLTGPAMEVFLMDKLSLNTGVLFSKQIETKHPLETDFNRKTGKRFEEEYRPYIPKDNPGIKDISIKTSFITMPVNFNYYINTWSRISFMISAGTKLDLSVYQDVNFSSGMSGDQINRRFEARPKPKVFNNLFYGMGVQYQYRGFVAQLAPYFEFVFRNPDYFSPPRKVGLNGSLKFEFGK
jgi:hypothetical protein